MHSIGCSCATSGWDDKLPQEQRQVILLVGFEGLRYQEAAEIFGVPVVMVRSRLSRGRCRLYKLMATDDEEDQWASSVAGGAMQLRAA